ncbi:CPBP family intramembrane metalloprotease [Roseateles sp. SL47]|uniref:CPBP family intramembrane glutamic endopeptidase n=1 Tax=Roseateles sp. SL47 TaxID=2995138 RepID=UPI00226FD696|nr:CPBP family intramembrane glutamic endopeptidase [Roseateles sp. SL47]WAC71805.1 CPBP family intramembrane metalloprotease [Roseateles sp. SL47]
MPVIDLPMPFVLLMLAIVAVWLPALKTPWGWTLPPWLVLYAAATALAVAQGYVDAVGVLSLVGLVLLAEGLRRKPPAPLYRPLYRPLHWPLLVALSLLAVALSLHGVPGFRNPVAINAVRFSDDARPFTQYLNFDKGSVGLVLMALLAPRLQSGDRVGRVLMRSAALAVVVAFFALSLALLLGMVRPDPKWPPQTVQFLVTNLLLTCVAEEALFRVMVQDTLARGTGASGSSTVGPWRVRALVAPGVSALLFGAAHAGGGPSMVAVATVAGVGYAAAYRWQRRIEAAVLLHFAVNALHFLLFTYPGKAPGA